MTMRLPQWIKTGSPADLHGTKYLLRRHGLATVCEEARCPNRGECFSRPTAAFMILGRSCTRGCGFCSVHTGPPDPPQRDEPAKVAAAAAEMGLRYVVITSVTRDDLPDGGSGQFAATVRALRKELPRAKIEVLTPDFQGDPEALMTVLRSGPDVFNHNMETVERLYPSVRPEADYCRSLDVLGKAKAAAPGIVVKSGFMLGLGEGPQEVEKLLSDLVAAGADMVTIGQYLRPTRKNLPVVEYVRPEVFETLRLRALGMGFRYAASGPLVRSSMNAEEMFDHV
ncbi:MAG: lipoyl synthase [Nitrospirae bacterium]|nr:MAG: lipoyl synthase [Nitrospirota bacterium]